MNGIVNIFKPAGMTSFAVCAVVRRLTGERKCGHGGTLDPGASGVLPVLLGKATRLSDVFLTLHKTYEARVRFGVSYDTGDVWGKPVGTASDGQRELLSALSFGKVLDAAAEFTGAVVQVPPAYSALKIGGVPAYKLARRGEAPQLQPRTVNIYSLEITGFYPDPEHPEATLRVECGRGTYIRTLCCDIAAALGVPGAMASLVRTSYGPLNAGEALTPAQLEAALTDPAKGEAASFLLPCDSILGGFPDIHLNGGQTLEYQFGRFVEAPAGLPEGGLARVYGDGGELLGLACVTCGGLRSRVNLA